MSFLDQLERALGRYAIRNLGLYLVIAQVFVFLTAMFGLVRLDALGPPPAKMEKPPIAIF